MATQNEVKKFVKSQPSIRFYKSVQAALAKVLLAMSDKDYKKATKNLFIAALHEGSLGQALHFQNPKGKFKILQLTFPRTIPQNVLEFVIAHELGHVMQGRNWQPSDKMNFEMGADAYAAKIGFIKTKSIARWMKIHGEKLGFLS